MNGQLFAQSGFEGRVEEALVIYALLFCPFPWRGMVAPLSTFAFQVKPLTYSSTVTTHIVLKHHVLPAESFKSIFTTRNSILHR